MLRVLGSPISILGQHSPSNITRRELLHAGGLTAAGLSLPQLLASQKLAAASTAPQGIGFGSAKRCLFLYLYGAPSQLETVDMKPHAPVEIRGTMKPIPSVVPGLDVCEHLPEMAKIMDRVTVVRSVTHAHPVHGVAFATTGIPSIETAMELSPYDQRHHPYVGSVVEYFERQKKQGQTTGIPDNLALPFPFSSQRVGEVARAGPYASYLGASYNPIYTEYSGKATRSVVKTLADRKIDCHDPYVGCDLESHFKLATTKPLPEVKLDRLNRRRTLLEQFDASRKQIDMNNNALAMSQYQDMAFSLITSREVSSALDIRSEPQATRDLYGMTLFGQSCLAGRRMLEAGTKLVSVFWDEYGLAGDAWDTHWNHYPRMLDQLLPPFDRAYSGLILDLEQRGMLDDTLVVCLSEHGRTPKLSTGRGGGRDHWSRAYSVMFAGGGIARGNVVGATDRHAGDPIDRPVGPKDLLATIYHALGIDPHATLTDRGNRQIPLVPESADYVPEMFG